MKTTMFTTGALTLSLLASSAMAAVSQSEAARLGSELTPVGAEKAGNAAGTIPAWTGGLAQDAAPVSPDGFVGDPYAGDKPKFTITALESMWVTRPIPWESWLTRSATSNSGTIGSGSGRKGLLARWRGARA